ncbi:hypothetical protein [Psychrobacillus sp. NPDC093180]
MQTQSKCESAFFTVCRLVVENYGVSRPEKNKNKKQFVDYVNPVNG